MPGWTVIAIHFVVALAPLVWWAAFSHRGWWQLGGVIVLTLFFGGIGFILLVAKLATESLKTPDGGDFMLQLYSNPLEFRKAHEDDWFKLDAHFYRLVTGQLLTLRFHQLDDQVVCSKAHTTRWAHAVVRNFVSDDGTIAAAVHHMRMSGAVRAIAYLFQSSDLKTIDLSTEFDDGTFLCTSNSAGVDRTADIPGIVKIRLKRSATVNQLLDAHRAAVQKLTLAATAVTEIVRRPITMRTQEQIDASGARAHVLKGLHRQSGSYDKASELDLIAGKRLSDDELAGLGAVRRPAGNS